MAAMVNAGIGFVVLMFLASVAFTDGHQCHKQRCLNCTSENLTLIGVVTTCNPNDLVNVGWLNDVHVEFPTLRQENGTIQEVNYACLKMYSDPETDIVVNAKPDVLRGCVTTDQAAIICSELTTEQKARGQKTVCLTCLGDLCNSAGSNGPAFTLLVIGTLIKMTLF